MLRGQKSPKGFAECQRASANRYSKGLDFLSDFSPLTIYERISDNSLAGTHSLLFYDRLQPLKLIDGYLARRQALLESVHGVFGHPGYRWRRG